MKRLVLTTILSFALLSWLSPALTNGQSKTKSAPIRIGIPRTVFVDVPDMLLDLAKMNFRKLVQEYTGMEGELVIVATPFELAKKIDSGEVHLGVMQGVECAWVRARHPELDPILLLLTCHPNVHAQLVVRKDANIMAPADLKGKEVAFPMKNREHCRLYMKRLCSECGTENAEAFFGKICRPASTEKAMDELVAGKVDAVLTDKVNVEFYKKIKPGHFARVTVLETSKTFPTASVLTRKGALDEKRLAQFRNGLLKATQSERGKDLMLTWEITEITPVAETYARDLEAILRVYPAPSQSAVSRR